MASNLLSLAGWYILPNLVTGYVQAILYAIFIRAGDPKPVPGTPRFIQHRRQIKIAVILFYLLYTIIDADYQLMKGGNFYSLLGVPHDVEERALQSRFRRLTVQYHPDKASQADKPAVEALYIQLKVARDALADPAKRFAYDRLGPDVLSWQTCKTTKDFIYHGMQQLTLHYIVSAAVLALLGVLGYFRQGMFWRYLVMGSLLTIELYVVTRPHFPATLTNFVNPLLAFTRLRQPYLPFQMILFFRKLLLSFFIAMAQIGPLLAGPDHAAAQDGQIPTQTLDRLDAVTNGVDQEINRLMALELTPFVQKPADAKKLRATMKEWLVQNTVRNDPEVSGAKDRVLDRRR